MKKKGKFLAVKGYLTKGMLIEEESKYDDYSDIGLLWGG